MKYKTMFRYTQLVRVGLVLCLCLFVTTFFATSVYAEKKKPNPPVNTSTVEKLKKKGYTCERIGVGGGDCVCKKKGGCDGDPEGTKYWCTTRCVKDFPNSTNNNTNSPSWQQQPYPINPTYLHLYQEPEKPVYQWDSYHFYYPSYEYGK